MDDDEVNTSMKMKYRKENRFFASDMSTKVCHSLCSLLLSLSLSLFLKKKSHRIRTNGRENRTRGRCNDTVTLTTATINGRKTTNHFNGSRRRRLARFQRSNLSIERTSSNVNE